MARITIEDCLAQGMTNRFEVTLAAAIAIRSGYLNRLMQQTETGIKTNNKPCVSALRAIAKGLVGKDMLLNIAL
jgi:DNA-directed RNA polymerase omega subunit